MTPNIALPTSVGLMAFAVALYFRYCVPLTVKVAGNGTQAANLAEGIITALIEGVEQRRGPILGSVGDDGRTVTLHTQVQAVTEGRLILRDRLPPGSWLTVTVAGG